MTSHPSLPRHPQPPPSTGRRGVRALLWVVLVLGAGADVVASAALGSPWAGSAFGLLVLACVAGLVGLTLRDRRARSARKAGA